MKKEFSILFKRFTRLVKKKSWIPQQYFENDLQTNYLHENKNKFNQGLIEKDKREKNFSSLVLQRRLEILDRYRLNENNRISC